MTTRRSFFSRVAAVIAAVALAPEIAFRAQLKLPIAPKPGYASSTVGIYEMLMNATPYEGGDLKLDDLLSQLYALKRHRDADPDHGGSILYLS